MEFSNGNFAGQGQGGMTFSDVIDQWLFLTIRWHFWLHFQLKTFAVGSTKGIFCRTSATSAEGIRQICWIWFRAEIPEAALLLNSPCPWFPRGCHDIPWSFWSWKPFPNFSLFFLFFCTSPPWAEFACATALFIGMFASRGPSGLESFGKADSLGQPVFRQILFPDY